MVGILIPWDFPVPLAAWKVAPALAAGNAVVLEPAEQTPLRALRLGELAAEAGGHPGVDAIAFTGSMEVGKIVMREAADADPKAAVRGAATGIYHGTGEACAAGPRVMGCVEAGKAEGARPVTGGERIQVNGKGASSKRPCLRT